MSLRCIASIHSYVVNEGKFDLTMDAFGKWYEYVHEENTCLETLGNCSFKEIFGSLNLVPQGTPVWGICVSALGRSFRVKPLNPESDQYLTSPYSNMAESFMKIMRIKETIATKEALIVKQILLFSTRRNV